MNRTKIAYLGLIIEIIGLSLMFICIIMNTIVPIIVQILIWAGLAITMFSTLLCPRNNKDKEEQENDTKKMVIFPLIVLIALTIALTLFSLK